MREIFINLLGATNQNWIISIFFIAFNCINISWEYYVKKNIDLYAFKGGV